MKLVTLKHEWLHGQEIYALVAVPYNLTADKLKLWNNCSVAPQVGDNSFATVNRNPTIEYRKGNMEVACLLLYGPSDAVYNPSFDVMHTTVHNLAYMGNCNEQCIAALRQYCDEELAFEQAEAAAKL